jgi:bifunctional DNA-binding transcriptional regulator/antitoxin component of YhaV-PrlF toxin-antitoxin module
MSETIKKYIENSGRVLLPKKFLQKLGISGFCNVTFTQNGIVVTKCDDKEHCCICGSNDDLIKLSKYDYICDKCREKVIKAR